LILRSLNYEAPVKRADAIASALLSSSYLPAAIAPTAATPTTTASAVAATAAAITSAAATTTSARSATAATLTRARFIDADIPPFEFRIIEFLNRPCGVVGIRHFDETEPSRLPRELVNHHYGAVNFAGLGEESFEILIGDRVGQITYVQFSGHPSPSLIFREARDRKTQAG
jgi:hypothetical protein